MMGIWQFLKPHDPKFFDVELENKFKSLQS